MESFFFIIIPLVIISLVTILFSFLSGIIVYMFYMGTQSLIMDVFQHIFTPKLMVDRTLELPRRSTMGAVKYPLSLLFKTPITIISLFIYIATVFGLSDYVFGRYLVVDEVQALAVLVFAVFVFFIEIISEVTERKRQASER